MPTVRTPKPRTTKPKLTPRVIAAYRAALALHNDPLSRYYEDDGGKREAYQTACVELHLLLDRKPWEEDLFDTIDSDQPPTWMRDDYHRASWLAARYLYEQLDEATT